MPLQAVKVWNMQSSRRNALAPIYSTLSGISTCSNSIASRNTSASICRIPGGIRTCDAAPRYWINFSSCSTAKQLNALWNNNAERDRMCCRWDWRSSFCRVYSTIEGTSFADRDFNEAAVCKLSPVFRMEHTLLQNNPYQIPQNFLRYVGHFPSCLQSVFLRIFCRQRF